MSVYTGVGSREIPKSVIGRIHIISRFLAGKGWTLRSGGADGADTAFEVGCDEGHGNKEIYLPWKGFNKSTSPLYTIPKEAFEIAATIHPNYTLLSVGAKRLHARNVLQVLGQDLSSPSDLVVCWTLDGKKSGGTRTAIVLAEYHKIPVINLATQQFELLPQPRLRGLV